MLIVLDPGHGGHDPGAVGPTGLRESDVVLDVARRARSLLEYRGHECRLTREADAYVTLGTRANFANILGADLFVSIHCNAHTSPDAHGTEVWHYEGSGAGRALAGAMRDQLVDRLGRRDRGVKATRSLAVLRATAMPAVLLELAFITHVPEEEVLKSDSARALAAVAIHDAVTSWLNRAYA